MEKVITTTLTETSLLDITLTEKQKEVDLIVPMMKILWLVEKVPIILVCGKRVQ
jgi:hypothetical protein